MYYNQYVHYTHITQKRARRLAAKPLVSKTSTEGSSPSAPASIFPAVKAESI